MAEISLIFSENLLKFEYLTASLLEIQQLKTLAIKMIHKMPLIQVF